MDRDWSKLDQVGDLKGYTKTQRRWEWVGIAILIAVAVAIYVLARS